MNLSSLPGNSAGDGRGHGTFVAGIAAGNASRYAGASPGSKIVSIDVMDDTGMAMTRDVIAAADWILANKDKYNIRVANFSLHSASPASVFFDPLDRAVERLWFNGVVVVAAAGNYGIDGRPSGVTFAPGNDPFVITVGAQRHPQLGVDARRHRRSLVGLRLHARRLLQARARRPRPLHRRPGARQLHARERAADEPQSPWLHGALRDLVRGSGRGRRGRPDPGPPPRVDAGPGQGRAHADRSAHAERGARIARRRRGRRGTRRRGSRARPTRTRP